MSKGSVSVAQLRLEMQTDTGSVVAARHGISRRTLYRKLGEVIEVSDDGTQVVSVEVKQNSTKPPKLLISERVEQPSENGAEQGFKTSTVTIETHAISLDWLGLTLADCIDNLRAIGANSLKEYRERCKDAATLRGSGDLEAAMSAYSSAEDDRQAAISAYSKAGTIAASLTRSAVLMKPKDSENELASATMASIEAEARAMLNEGKKGNE